jgi:hypothetical protein
MCIKYKLLTAHLVTFGSTTRPTARGQQLATRMTLTHVANCMWINTKFFCSELTIPSTKNIIVPFSSKLYEWLLLLCLSFFA